MKQTVRIFCTKEKKPRINKLWKNSTSKKLILWQLLFWSKKNLPSNNLRKKTIKSWKKNLLNNNNNNNNNNNLNNNNPNNHNNKDKKVSMTPVWFSEKNLIKQLTIFSIWESVMEIKKKSKKLYKLLLIMSIERLIIYLQEIFPMYHNSKLNNNLPNNKLLNNNPLNNNLRGKKERVEI